MALTVARTFARNMSQPFAAERSETLFDQKSRNCARNGISQWLRCKFSTTKNRCLIIREVVMCYEFLELVLLPHTRGMVNKNIILDIVVVHLSALFPTKMERTRRTRIRLISMTPQFESTFQSLRRSFRLNKNHGVWRIFPRHDRKDVFKRFQIINRSFVF